MLLIGRGSIKATSIIFSLILLCIVSTVSGKPCIRYDHNDSCTSYPITDFYIGLPISQTDSIITRKLDMTTSIGWMFVLNKKYDLGPSLFYSAYKNGGWHSQMGIRANLRYHFADDFHFDLSPGFILTDSPFPDGFAGYTVEFSLGWKDCVGIASRLDFVDTFESDHDQVLQISLRFGSYAGMSLTSVGIIGGGIAYMSSQMD